MLVLFAPILGLPVSGASSLAVSFDVLPNSVAVFYRRSVADRWRPQAVARATARTAMSGVGSILTRDTKPQDS